MAIRHLPALIQLDVNSLGGQVLANLMLKAMHSGAPPRFPRGWKVVAIEAIRDDAISGVQVVTVSYQIDGAGSTVVESSD